MIPETKTTKPSATPTPPAAEDLSKAIEQTVETQADEQVEVVRVFGDRYRCNWWVREKAAHWLSCTSGRIRRSKFLRVTRAADRLLIEDLDDRR